MTSFGGVGMLDAERVTEVHLGSWKPHTEASCLTPF